MAGPSPAPWMWPFEIGNSLAGFDGTAVPELQLLRIDPAQRLAERDMSVSVANMANACSRPKGRRRTRLRCGASRSKSTNLRAK